MFAEIIRQSRDRPQSPLTKPASHILFDAIRNTGIDPIWEELTLPSGEFARKIHLFPKTNPSAGRSLRSCRDVFHEFPRHSSGTFLPLHSPYGASLSDHSRK